MSAIDELRRAYRALGWSLWRLEGSPRLGHRCTLYYATTASGRYVAGQGETIWTDSPLATLEAVLAHPSTKRALEV